MVDTLTADLFEECEELCEEFAPLRPAPVVVAKARKNGKRRKKEKVLPPKGERRFMARNHPGAVYLRDRFGVCRWYVPVDVGGPKGGTTNRKDALAVLESRTAPISPRALGNLMGMGRHVIHKDIERGVFGEGMILKSFRTIRIKPEAALKYYKDALYDPRD